MKKSNKNVTKKTNAKPSAKSQNLAVKNTAKKKKDKRVKKIIKRIFFLIIIIGISIAFVLLSGLFNLKEIIVQGNNKVSKDQIISFSQINSGENIFLLDKKAIKNSIEENSYVKTAEIKKIFPNKIKIIINERVAKYMIEVSNSYAYIDEEGVVLEITNEKAEIPIIIGVNTDLANINLNDKLNEEDIERINDIEKIMDYAEEENLKELITKIDISTNEYDLYVDSQNKIIHLGYCDNLKEKFLYVKSIMEYMKEKKGEIFVNVDFNNEEAFFRENG